MSKFLAPIHGWLFNKVVLLESIEKNIITRLSNDETHMKYQQTHGNFLPNEPLENLIDQGNIHGWLAEQIRIAETRQADFVNDLIKSDEANRFVIENIYAAAGENAATRLSFKSELATDVLTALNGVLLEGMPCDRVNVVTEQTDDLLVWETNRCVHKPYWDAVEANVADYYHFRHSFSKAFVKNLNNVFEYSYTNNDVQTHTIKKA